MGKIKYHKEDTADQLCEWMNENDDKITIIGFTGSSWGYYVFYRLN